MPSWKGGNSIELKSGKIKLEKGSETSDKA